MNPLSCYRDDGPIIGGLSRLAARPDRSVGARTAQAKWGAPAVILAAGCLLVAMPIIGSIPLTTAALTAFVVVVGVAAGAVPRSRWAWLVPAAVRGVEFAGVIRLSQLYPEPVDVPTGALLAVLALHYYDIVYRQRTCGAAPARWACVAGGGWEVRLLLISVLAATSALPVALTAASAALGVLFLVDMVICWVVKPVSSSG